MWGKILKLLHTIGSVGFMGATASLLVLIEFLPPTYELETYARMRAAMGAIADWLFLPSLVAILMSGLFAVVLRPAFIHSGWVVVKLAVGILVFEQSLIAIHGPMDFEARLSADALAGAADPERLGRSLWSEAASLWVMTFIAVLNIWLGVMRPSFRWRRKPAAVSHDASAETAAERV